MRSSSPGIAQALDIAMQHHQAGRLQEAERLYRQVLAAQPDQAEALGLLGTLAVQRANHAQGIELLRKAVAVAPDYAEAHFNLGNALAQVGRHEEAIVAYRDAVKFGADFPQVHFNLGLLLQKAARAEEAIWAYRRTIELDPNHGRAQFNLGALLWAKGSLQQALSAHARAAELMPNSVDAQNALGVALRDSGEFDAALAAFERAIALDAGVPEPHINRGMLMLLPGRYEQGWPEYEWRLRSRKLPLHGRTLAGPAWDGGELGGRTILLYAEQGFGDAIQFVRYLPMVATRATRAARAGRIILDCHGSMRRLFERCGGISEVVTWDQKLPAYETHCSLLSLPAVFGTTLSTVPATVPYLSGGSGAGAGAEDFRERLQSDSNRLRVGLAWAGSPEHRTDRLRSLHFSELAPLARVAKVGDVSFHSLQKGPAAAQVRQAPGTWKITDWSERLNDFADTADLISNLDLVIAADTAVAHLAGALGKPVWVLLPFVPDWRWLLDTESSVWYPTMRLFRQQRVADWNSVVERVFQELTKLVQTQRFDR